VVGEGAIVDCIEELAKGSLNFGFLLPHERLLVKDGAWAEALVYRNPDIAMFLVRRFTETLAALAASRHGVAGSRATQHERVKALADAQVISRRVRGKFDRVRLLANSVVHGQESDPETAVECLECCFDIGVWFHRHTTGDGRPMAFVHPEQGTEANALLALLAELAERDEDLQAEMRSRDRFPREVLPLPALPSATNVLTHREFLAQLAPTRNLTSDRLRFVSPGARYEADPGRLLAALRQRANGRGILLVGPAGAGKSRTGLEVAALAQAASMRALHVRSGPPRATIPDVREALLAGSAPTLVIIDDLSDCPDLIHSDLCALLAEAARSRGTEVSVLASARPGWTMFEEADPVRREFDVVELRIGDEHRDAVRDAILDVEAKTALRVFRRRQVEQFCGRRPAFTTLKARELEQRAKLTVDGLGEGGFTGTPREDLDGWLLRRLQEDHLLVPRPRNAAERSGDPGGWNLVAAAVTAACPLPREALELAALRVLGDRPDAEEMVQDGIDRLLDMRWIEYEDGDHVAVHGSVVDVLLEQVLLKAPGSRVRRTIASDLLRPAVGDVRLAGRLASHLTRLVRDLRIRGRGDDLAAFCGDWLRENAAKIGAAVAEDSDNGGFVLSVFLSGPPWAEAAQEQWLDLIGPWLGQHSETLQARHLYARGLGSAPAERSAHLTARAVEWLDTHGLHPYASFVLSALLKRNDLNDNAATVVRHALGWLRTNATRGDAEFVLSALLARDLGAQGPVAVEMARRWLRSCDDQGNMGWLLGALVDPQVDLGLAEKEITVRALRWLNDHRGLAAGRVLSGMVHRGIGESVAPALQWLDVHSHGNPTKRHIYEALLSFDGLGSQALEQVVAGLQAWMADDPVRRQGYAAGFTLKHLLDRDDLGPHLAAAVELSQAWLGPNGMEPVAGSVLIRMLRCDLGEQRGSVLGFARGWLREHHLRYDSVAVLQAVVSESEEETVGHGVRWLGEYGGSRSAGPLILALLGHPGLGAQAEAVTAYAHRWLITHPSEPQTEALRAALDGSGSDLDDALTWIAGRRPSSAGDILIRHLLLRRGDEFLATHGLAWLGRNTGLAEAQPIAKALLTSPGLGEAAIDYAVSWIAATGASGRGEILRLVLNHPNLGDHALRAVEAALAWLEEDEEPTREPHHVVLIDLLKAKRFSDRLLDQVVRWLSTHDQHVHQVVTLVLREPQIHLGSRARPIAEVTLAWLRANPCHRDAYSPLSRMLLHPELQPWSPQIIAASLAWLDATDSKTRDHHLIAPLLARPDLADHAPRAANHARHWLTRHPDHPRAPELATHLP
jgi:hypothetical protein